MKTLAKNERKLFFSKKNLVLSIILFVLMVFMYKSYTVKNYKYYIGNLNYENSQRLENSKLIVEEMKVRQKSLKKLIEDAEEIEHPKEKDLENIEKWKKEIDEIEEDRNKWSVINSNLGLLDLFLNEERPNLSSIEEVWVDIDHFLDTEVYEKEFKSQYPGLYLKDGRYWNRRKLLREANQDIPYKHHEAYPSGLKAVFDIVAGENMRYMAILVMFIVLANFDGWTNDFEENEGKIILTLPYEKRTLYYTRFFSRFLCTLGLILLSILIVFILASIKYGVGPNRMVLINELTIKNPFVFYTDIHWAWQHDIPVTLSKYISYAFLVFILFIFFIYSLTNLISILIRDGVGILAGGILFTVLVAVVDYLKYSNLFSYYKVQDMIYMIPYYQHDWFWGIGLYSSILLIASLVSAYLGKVKFKRL